MNETSPQNHQTSDRSLPDSWVAVIFKEFGLMYGSRVADLWAGQDPEEVRAYWGRKLAWCQGKPACIRAALEACKGMNPPSEPEFNRLCQEAARHITPEKPSLPAPEITKEQADARAAKAAAIADKFREFAPSTDWAKKLRTRYLSGERLLPVQIDMASSALGETWALNSVEITERLAA